MAEQTSANSSEDDAAEHCWICLAGPASEEPLISPCSCPRKVHHKCIALWQLHSAGKDEEKRCRFCDMVLPDWKPKLTPANLTPAIPVVSVHYNSVCYRLRVRPGPDGFAQFQRQLQRITGAPCLDEMQITFQCKAPDTAQELSLKGISSFDAAIHCAAISAAERLASRPDCHSTSPQHQHTSQSLSPAMTRTFPNASSHAEPDSRRPMVPTSRHFAFSSDEAPPPPLPHQMRRSLDEEVAPPSSLRRASHPIPLHNPRAADSISNLLPSLDWSSAMCMGADNDLYSTLMSTAAIAAVAASDAQTLGSMLRRSPTPMPDTQAALQFLDDSYGPSGLSWGGVTFDPSSSSPTLPRPDAARSAEAQHSMSRTAIRAVNAQPLEVAAGRQLALPCCLAPGAQAPRGAGVGRVTGSSSAVTALNAQTVIDVDTTVSSGDAIRNISLMSKQKLRIAKLRSFFQKMFA